jgi:hypothetical protein
MILAAVPDALHPVLMQQRLRLVEHSACHAQRRHRWLIQMQQCQCPGNIPLLLLLLLLRRHL